MIEELKKFFELLARSITLSRIHRKMRRADMLNVKAKHLRGEIACLWFNYEWQYKDKKADGYNAGHAYVDEDNTYHNGKEKENESN